MVAAALCTIAPAIAEGLAGRLVQDHSGAAVASADVKVYRVGERWLAADLESDGEGRFHAEGLEAGEYRIEVSKPGYVGTTLPLRIGAGETAKPMLRLVRCGAIQGRVTNAAGQPVRPAHVRAINPAAGGGVMQPLLQRGTLTPVDEQGRYRLYNLVPGEYKVAVTYGASTSQVSSTGILPPLGSTGSGALVHERVFTVTGGEEYKDIDFTVLTGALFTVSGKVELPAPKQAFWVTLTPVDRPLLASAVTPAEDDGAFRIEGVAAGSYNLFAFGPVTGYGGGGAGTGADPAFARMRVDIAGQDVSGLVVSPRKGATATLRLKAGAGCKQATVSAMLLEEWAVRLNKTVQVTADKDTVVPDLPPGRYQFVAQPAGNCYQTGEATADLTSGEAEPVAIAMAPAGSIRGRLIGGKPADFAVVLVAEKTFGGEQAVRVALPDGEGRFAFDALPAGEYRIAAHSAAESPRTRWMSADLMTIQVPGGAPTDVELPAVAKP